MSNLPIDGKGDTQMTNASPEKVVLRCRSEPLETFNFEVYDVADGQLIMKEPPERIASWLKECGYHWVYGSSGVWERHDDAQDGGQGDHHLTLPKWRQPLGMSAA